MPTCIYCLKNKPSGEFTREHVLPRAFGRFKKALVLHEEVCAKCNAYFGRDLDMGLAREGLEGLERFAWGVKAPPELRKFRYNRVRLHALAAGEWEGCILELVEDATPPDGIKAVPVPQVGFARKDGSGFEFYSVEDYLARRWRSDTSIDPIKGVKVIEADEAFVKADLESLGISFSSWRPMALAPAEPRIQEVVHFPHVHLRALAKIAFNYLAYTHGPDFCLASDFDSTRRYIRRGVEPFLPAVSLSADEIANLPEIERKGERFVAHLVTVTVPLNADVTLGQVTLFNWMRYDVVLAHRAVPGLQRHGHLYNPSELEVYGLGYRTRGDTVG
jgi:hypothetical protein